jgi:mannan endo-1,4-beta-mannosidase
MVLRYNAYAGLDYRDDPTIMAWELANEPRPIKRISEYLHWIKTSTAFIKSLDTKHLVTIGSEGDTSAPAENGLEYFRDHNFKDVDYGTAHVWIQNWGWYDPQQPEATYPSALKHAQDYLERHLQKTLQLDKPLVVEEFGIARDQNSFDPSSKTTWRDRYYEAIFAQIYRLTEQAGGLAGVNFWAWAGEARPRLPYGSYWKPGDPLLGDPPHEQQGWYSVYDSDLSTLTIISKYARMMGNLSRPPQKVSGD